mmetsp:Transcript_56270/g.164456  ORF Transcript_56270/g.164456 Transcript_56270/m.164456 type:complete len:658 (-) Transcript_56270:499-2472(-)
MVILILYIVGMSCVSAYALQNGNPRRLTHAYDYKGRLCGVDPAVKDMPLVYWCGAGTMLESGIPSALDLQFPTCVSECPTGTTTGMACLGIERVQVDESGEKPFVTEMTTITQSTVRQSSYPTMELGGLYCIPHLSEMDLPGDDSLTQSLMGSSGPLGNSWVRLTAAVGGLHRCWAVVAWAMVFAVGLGYGYLFLLNKHAKPLVLGSLIMVTAGLSIIGLYYLIGSVLSGGSQEAWEDGNLIFRQYDRQTATSVSRGLGLVFLGAGVVTALFTYFSQEAINRALGCVQPACECIFAMPSMLLQPVIEVVWKLLMGSFLLSGFAWLLSTAHMQPDFIKLKGEEVGGLTRSLDFPFGSKVMAVYYGFGLVWLMELTNAMSQFVISYSVILWYYTPKPKGYGPHIPLVRGFIVGVVFHLGSLALGAFLMLVCRPVRAVMGYISKQAKSPDNQVFEKVARSMEQCISCYQKYVEFISKNAYIDVCISSTSFCTAAKNSFGFVVSEGGKVLTLTGACYIFTIAGTLGIAFLTGLLTYLLVTTNGTWTSSDSPHYVENPHFVAAVAAALAGYTAMCFMIVFDHTSDALLYTYVWNKFHGHNTVQKYASDSLVGLTEYKPLAKQTGRQPKAAATTDRPSFFSNPFQRPASTEESQSLVRSSFFS